LDVSAGGTTVSDLGSKNGVYVNGNRVGATPVALNDGDLMLVGGEEVEIGIGAAVFSRRAGAATQPEEETLSRLALTPEDPEADARPTLVSNPLEVVGNVAERMIAAGHGRNAEDMLRGHLIAIRDDVLLKRKVSSRTQDRAVDLALQLAQTLHKGDWFDYAVDVLRGRDSAVPAHLVAKLGATLPMVSRVDAEKLRKLAAALRAGIPDLDRLRSAQLLDKLVERASGQQR
jgi:hypothetical protein